MSHARPEPVPRSPNFSAFKDTFKDMPPSDNWVNYIGGATNTLDGLELPTVSEPPDAPSLVGSETGGGSVSNVTVNVPSGTSQGDRMLAFVSSDGGSLTAPSGWNEINHKEIRSSSVRIYERTAGSNEPSSYTWSFSNDVQNHVIQSSWSGVRSIREDGINTVEFSDSVSAPSFDATFKDTLVLMGFHEGTGDSPSWTDPEGNLTEVDSSGNLIVKSYDDVISTGSTDSYELQAGVSTEMAAASLLLTPEGDPPQEEGFSAVESSHSWSLLGSFVRSQLVDTINPAGASEAYTQIIIEGPGTGDRLSITHNAVDDELEFMVVSNSTTAASASVSYDSVDHQFLRIREVNRELSFQTSESGWDGSWTTHLSETTPQWVVDYNNELRLSFRASRDGGDNDSAFWTNLNSGDTRSLIAPSQTYVEWPLGIFLLSSPQQSTDENGVVTRSVEGYDKTQIYIDDRTVDRFSTANIKYINDNFNRTEELEGEWGNLETGGSWVFQPYLDGSY